MRTTTSTTITANSRREAELRYNVYGGNVGGPLFIPHVYNSDEEQDLLLRQRRMAQGNQRQLAIADQQYSVSRSRYFGGYLQLRDSCVQPGPQVAAGVGKQVFVPTTADPAFNAKLTAAGLTPGQPFPNNTIPGTLLRFQRSALQHAEEYSRCDQPVERSIDSDRGQNSDRRARRSRSASTTPSTTNGSFSATTFMMR